LAQLGAEGLLEIKREVGETGLEIVGSVLLTVLG
jgi:hypothetical protein